MTDVKSILRPHLALVSATFGTAFGFLLALVVLRPGAIAPPQANAASEALATRPKDVRAPSHQGPGVQVLTFLPELPASSMEKVVTDRVERWVNQAAGVRRLESRTIAGVSIVRVYFRDDVDPGVALVQVAALAQAVLPALPPGILPPLILPLTTDHTRPVGLVTLTSPDLSEAALKDIARIEVRNALRAIKGCAAPAVLGGKDRQVVIHLDAAKLQARNLSSLDVVEALRKGNLTVTAGTASLGDSQVIITGNAGIEKIDDLDDLPVGTKPGAMIFLRDIGQAKDAYAPQMSRVRINGRPGVCLPVYHLEGDDPTALRERLKEAIPAITRRLPKGTRLEFLPFGVEQKGGRQPDTGLITLSIRAPSQSSLDASEKRVAEIERSLEEAIPARERAAIVSELGVHDGVAVGSTQNDGPQDTTIRVQLSGQRKVTAREYAGKLRRLLSEEAKFADLSIHIETDGEETPLDIRIEGGKAEVASKLAGEVRQRVSRIKGVADAETVQRLDAPALLIEVDRQKAAALGLSAQEVVKQAMAAMTSRVPADRPLWIDFRGGNRLAVAVQSPEAPERKLEDVLNVPLTFPNQRGPLKLSSLATIRRQMEPVRIDHVGLRRIFNVRLNVEGREVPDVASDVRKALDELQVPEGLRLSLEVKDSHPKIE